MILRLIGDVHGHDVTHREYAEDADYSIQLGDYGFDFDALSALDPAKHKLFGGNHDHYPLLRQSPYNLGDYGLLTHIPELLPKTFFVRGAWSIDRKYRVPGVNWWPEEELTSDEGDAALAAYIDAKPDILLSHESPYNLLPHMDLSLDFARDFGFDTNCIPTRTNQLIDKMIEAHRPKLHVFGHLHRDFAVVLDGTQYVCLTADPSLKKKQRYLDIILDEPDQPVRVSRPAARPYWAPKHPPT